jgi:hypothetical protein
MRVRFPDGYILEADFLPSERIHSLVELLMKVIARPDLPFYICKFLYSLGNDSYSRIKFKQYQFSLSFPLITPFCFSMAILYHGFY